MLNQRAPAGISSGSTSKSPRPVSTVLFSTHLIRLKRLLVDMVLSKLYGNRPALIWEGKNNFGMVVMIKETLNLRFHRALERISALRRTGLDEGAE